MQYLFLQFFFFTGHIQNNNTRFAKTSHISSGIYTALSTPKEDHAAGLNLHDEQFYQLFNGSVQANIIR